MQIISFNLCFKTEINMNEQVSNQLTFSKHTRILTDFLHAVHILLTKETNWTIPLKLEVFLKKRIIRLCCEINQLQEAQVPYISPE